MKLEFLFFSLIGINLLMGCNSNPQTDLIKTDSLHVELDTIQESSQIKMGIPEMKYSVLIMNDSIRKHFRKEHS